MKRYFIHIFLLLSFVLSEQVLAQEQTLNSSAIARSPTLLWLSGGAGIGTNGLSGLIEGTYSWDERTLGLKYSLFSIISGHGGGTVNELSIYYGALLPSRKMIVRYAGGVGVFSTQQKITPGIGGETEVMFKAGPIGIGLMGSLVLTSGFSSLNLTLNLSLGKLE